MRWVRDHRVAVTDDMGSVREIVGVATDITDERRSELALRQVTEGTTATGEDFFESLVTSLSRVLRARWALVGIPRADGTVESIAFAQDGAIVDSVEYSLQGTPCEQVLESRELCFYTNGVADEFPSDQMLRDIGAEAYLGMPLVSSTGETIGLLVVMNDRPLDESMRPASILRIFAARAGAETERVLAERLLKESRETLLEAQRIARLGNFDWDLTTGEMHWSPGLFDLLGYSTSEIAPSYETLIDLVPSPVRKDVDQQIMEAIRHGSEYSVDHPISGAGNLTRHVLSKGRIERGRNGNAIRVIGTIHDLLEDRVMARTRDLVRANEALHVSERRMRAMFENSGAGVILMDDECRILQINPAMCQMLEREEQSLMGTRLPDLKHPDDRAACEVGTRAVIEGVLESEQHEARLRRSDGAYVWTRTTLSRMPVGDADGVGILAIVEDVTQEVLAKEEAMQRQEELAHVSRFIALGELAAGLAHELNQPLAAVSAYADTCARRLRAEDRNREAHALVEKIGDQARRAGEIVHRLKNLVRKRAPQRENFDLAAVLNESIELMVNEARARRLTIQRDMPASFIVQGDPVQIQQVAINLLKNAIEASPRPGSAGSPEVDRNVLITVRKDASDGIVIGVRNMCAGGRQDLEPEIFDLFFSTRSQGMGLGLPISRSIVEAHGGRIWTETTDDGTWFYFSLPVPEGVPHDAVGFSRIRR
jgi:PAS domain S-box-containing protein